MYVRMYVQYVDAPLVTLLVTPFEGTLICSGHNGAYSLASVMGQSVSVNITVEYTAMRIIFVLLYPPHG